MSALIQHTPEWHQMRRNHIGASDAPVVMEVSPWKTPYKLWMEKLGLGSTIKTQAMQRGLDLEQSAREAYEKATGLFIVPDVVLHKSIDFMMASLDGIDPERKKIVEIKCAGKEDHSLALNGEIPVKYIPQLMHQMEVCEVERMDYYSFDGHEGVIVPIQRDDQYIKRMITKEKEFWDCVQELRAPVITHRDYNHKTDDIWLAMADEWRTLSGMIKDLEAQEAELRKLLISTCDDQSCLGGGIAVSKVVRKGNIDYSKIPELKDVDLEQYRGQPVEYWKISKS
jgi:putative phage-type endonuclease